MKLETRSTAILAATAVRTVTDMRTGERITRTVQVTGRCREGKIRTLAKLERGKE